MSKYGHNNNSKNNPAWVSKDSTLQKELDSQERVDLNPSKFDRLINQKGVRVKIYRSMPCPNVKSVDGAEHGDINCPLCNDSHFVDVDPICSLAVIQEQSLENNFGEHGYNQGNTVKMTFLTGIELQYFTKIELMDFTDIVYQRILRDSTSNNLTDVLMYPACKINVIMDSAGKKYYQNQDFKIDVNGNILWFLGSEPLDGVIYTIHYEAKVQFRAFTAMHVNRFSQYKKGGTQDTVEHVKFPETWICKKEFLVTRKDLEDNQLVQGPYDRHVIIED